MEDFLDAFPEDATKWETIRDIVDIDVQINEDNKYDPKHMHSVHLLPRQDVALHGFIPKLDETSYIKCKECRLVFHSRDILAHRACSRQFHFSSTPNSSRKSRNKRNSNKKTPTLPPPPLFKKPPSPTVSTSLPEKATSKMSLLALLSKASTTGSTSSTSTTSAAPIKIEAKVTPSKETPKLHLVYPAKLPTSTSASVSRENSNSSTSHSSSTNSRHKKSKRNTNSKTTKDSDVTDVNLGVAELVSRPETFPVTIPVPIKSVPIVLEKATVKLEMKSEESDVELPGNKSLPLIIPVPPKLQKIPTGTENISIKPEIKTEKIEMDIPESNVTTLPVVYMPVSPISVITYPQDLKASKDFYVCIVKNDVKNENMSNNCIVADSTIEIPITTDKPRLYSIPNHNLNVKRYKSHPKPIAVPTYSTKKIGGAILLSNQRIERQRNDIIMAINKSRNNQPPGYNRGISLLNHTNSSIRPNILKVKSMNKVNCKRISNERTSSTENKQIKLTSNINGFILHSDMIDCPETTFANNCIQEKIAYFM